RTHLRQPLSRQVTAARGQQGCACRSSRVLRRCWEGSMIAADYQPLSSSPSWPSVWSTQPGLQRRPCLHCWPPAPLEQYPAG
ncbi:hypothetical protein HaLaN_01375, partial [Haematococcus lacustris]